MVYEKRSGGCECLPTPHASCLSIIQTTNMDKRKSSVSLSCLDISSKLIESKEDVMGILDKWLVKSMNKTTQGLRLAPGAGSSLIG